MKKLKIIKKNLKKQNLWNKYCHKFNHKQMRLIFSKISLIFNSETEVEWLINQEIRLLHAAKNEQMFICSFAEINQLTDKKYDWIAFGKLIWYIFQTSTFYHDQKQKIFNIFNKDNYIKLNLIKRNYFYDWLESIPTTEENFNDKIKSVLNEIF